MPEPQPLRVALIGAGRIGCEVFLPLLGSLPGVVPVMVADPEPEARRRAQRLAPSARVVPEWQEITDGTPADAAVIAVPSEQHAEVAARLLQRGIATYIEKPLATSIDGAQRVVDAYRTSGVAAMVGFNYRANPLYEALRTRVRSGEIGTIRFIRTVFASSQPMNAWRQNPATGGGVLFDLASHHMDLVRYISGHEIRDAHSICRDADRAMVTLQLFNDIVVSSTFAASAPDDDRVEVYGTDGMLSVDRYRSLDVERRGMAVPGRFQQVTRALSALPRVTYAFKKLREPWHEPSFRIALQRFVAAVRTAQPVTPDPFDGWASLAAVLAAQRSAIEGTRVAVEPTPESADRGVAHAS